MTLLPTETAEVAANTSGGPRLQASSATTNVVVEMKIKIVKKKLRVNMKRE